jgi:hypothetical protein
VPTVVISDDTTGRDFTGVEDVRIRLAAPTTNDGSGTTLEATAYDVGDDNRFLIRFTGLSNIPSNATVSSVTLTLNCITNLANVTAPNEVQIYRCTRAFVEGQATWNIYSTGNSWATAGGRGTGDSEASASHTEAPSSGTGDKTFSGSGLVTDVQAWIDGSVTNNGWLIKHSGDPSGSLQTKVFEFVSSEGADGSRPSLSVTYTVPASSNLGHPFRSSVFNNSVLY